MFSHAPEPRPLPGIFHGYALYGANKRTGGTTLAEGLVNPGFPTGNLDGAKTADIFALAAACAPVSVHPRRLHPHEREIPFRFRVEQYLQVRRVHIGVAEDNAQGRKRSQGRGN